MVVDDSQVLSLVRLHSTSCHHEAPLDCLPQLSRILPPALASQPFLLDQCLKNLRTDDQGDASSERASRWKLNDDDNLIHSTTTTTRPFGRVAGSKSSISRSSSSSSSSCDVFSKSVKMASCENPSEPAIDLNDVTSSIENDGDVHLKWRSASTKSTHLFACDALWRITSHY